MAQRRVDIKKMFSLNLSMKSMALSLLVIVNYILTFSNLIKHEKQSYSNWFSHSAWSCLNIAYTAFVAYFSDDYPLEAPIDNLERVAMTLFEGTHFQLNLSDRISSMEWRSIYSGSYTMHLGIEQRVFLIA